VKAPAKPRSKGTPSIAQLSTAQLDQASGGNPFFLLGVAAYLLTADSRQEK